VESWSWPTDSCDPGPEGPFFGLSGYWSGSGTITMSNGAEERIRCRATYAVNGAGRALQQTLRCASDSYRLDISSNVVSEGGALSGSWSEATAVCREVFPAAPAVHRLWPLSLGLDHGRLDVRTQGNRQSVSIRPSGGTDVSAVSIALHKG